MNGAFDGRRFSFARGGGNVTIYEWVRVLVPERISVDDHVVIDDFVFLDGKGGVDIGPHVHIVGCVSLIGGGRLELGAFCGLAACSRIITGTDLADGSGLIGPTVPNEMRAVRRGRVVIGEHAFVGTNAIIHPDVTIGTGAVVGSGAVVTRDLEPWTINVGIPARPVKDRPRGTILRLAEELRVGGMGSIPPGDP